MWRIAQTIDWMSLLKNPGSASDGVVRFIVVV